MIEVNSSAPDNWFSLIIFVIFCITPIAAVIWLFSWMKDIRNDTQKIKCILKKRFPEDFADEEEFFPHQDRKK